MMQTIEGSITKMTPNILNPIPEDFLIRLEGIDQQWISRYNVKVQTPYGTTVYNKFRAECYLWASFIKSIQNLNDEVCFMEAYRTLRDFYVSRGWHENIFEPISNSSELTEAVKELLLKRFKKIK